MPICKETNALLRGSIKSIHLFAVMTIGAAIVIFAFPSLDEGFGMPILEAMAHEVPVITSNCSAMPEVSGDAALLVDPLNIGDALLRLATDESLRETLIRRGRERIKQFTWDSAVEKTWALYDELR